VGRRDRCWKVGWQGRRTAYRISKSREKAWVYFLKYNEKIALIFFLAFYYGSVQTYKGQNNFIVESPYIYHTNSVKFVLNFPYIYIVIFLSIHWSILHCICTSR
jgi:hypothetical protein